MRTLLLLPPFASLIYCCCYCYYWCLRAGGTATVRRRWWCLCRYSYPRNPAVPRLPICCGISAAVILHFLVFPARTVLQENLPVRRLQLSCSDCRLPPHRIPPRGAVARRVLLQDCQPLRWRSSKAPWFDCRYFRRFYRPRKEKIEEEVSDYKITRLLNTPTKELSSKLMMWVLPEGDVAKREPPALSRIKRSGIINHNCRKKDGLY